MIDRMLLTGIAIGALPQLLHARFWFQSTLAPWQVLLLGLPLGWLFVEYMARFFGRYSFLLVQRFLPGSMQQMNARNVVISLAMLWLGTFLYLGAVTIVGRFTGDWLTAGNFWAVAVGTVIVGACFALTHHANHMNSPTEA
jgi:hypothetical protein